MSAFRSLTTHQSFPLSIASACVLAFLLFPWKSQIVPPWKIMVVDEYGNRIKGLTVTQSWIEPNWLAVPLEEDFRSDEDGFVHLPERNAWRNMLFVIVSSVVNRGAGGTKKYAAVVFGWGDYTNRDTAGYVRGQPLPDKLVMRR